MSPAFYRVLCVAACALALAACNTVVGSQRVGLDVPPTAYSALPDGTPCTSALGSYALPKAFLRIRIAQVRDKSLPPEIYTEKAEEPPVQVIRHPDPRLFFCLDHLNLPNSDDRVIVQKWPSKEGPTVPRGSFLGAVTVNATDQTAYIIRALIRTAFIAVTGDYRSGADDQKDIIGDFEFDPFNQRESATVNAQLRKHGYCLLLESFMFDPAIDVQRYCDAPLRHSVEATKFFKAYHKMDLTAVDPKIEGLLYRPRAPYRLFIYRKRDPDSRRDRWELQHATTVQLENLSPVLSLRIDRAAFARRTTHFFFEEGTLIRACVSKTSEAAGFVEIPLDIARAIVSVPASIASVRIGEVNDQKKLIDAQKNLADMQKVYFDRLAGGQPTIPGAPPNSTAVPTLNLGVPDDIAKARLATKAVWDNDLFNNALATVCGGDQS